MNKLPENLFRGDSAPQNKRKLKDTFKGGLLFTNLCHGGNGREIFSKVRHGLHHEQMIISICLIP